MDRTDEEQGSVRVRTEVIDSVRAENYRGTFAPASPRPVTGSVLPPGWEGLYFPFSSSMDGLRPDGTPLDDVVPDFGLPRRMYAGEDTVFHRPLQVGDTVEQRESLGTVQKKTGKRGRLVFADIKRRFFVEGELAIETVWHDVFLDGRRQKEREGQGSQGSEGSQDGRKAHSHAGGGPPRGAKAAAGLGDEWWSETFTPDSRHLFRFSALTFNSHRVHYDRTWARRSEDLPDLLVHGPLTRLLLLDAAGRRRPGRFPARFGFTASAPLFVDEEITIAGRDAGEDGVEVVALDAQGLVAARGTADW